MSVDKTSATNGTNVGRSRFATLLSLLPGSRGGLTLALLAGLAMVIPGILIPAFSKIFIDDVLVAGKSHWLIPLLSAMLIAMVVRSLLIWLQRSVLLALETRYALISSSKVFHHVLRLPMAFFFRNYAGAISARVELSNRVAKLVAQETAVIGLQFILAMFYGGAMFLYDPILATIGLTMGVVSFLIVQSKTRSRQPLVADYLEQTERFLGMGMAGMQNLQTIKATASEQDFFNRWAGCQAKAKNAMNRLERWSRLFEPLPRLLSDVGTVAILFAGAVLVMHGRLTLGEVVAVLALQVAFSVPICEIVQFVVSLQTAGGYLDRLDHILDEELDQQFHEREQGYRKDVIRLSGRLDIDNVTFGYDSEQEPVIKEFNLSLKPGSRVALVGRTGAGKSSIANLISGQYTPWKGQILFDNISALDISPSVIALSRATVNQNAYLFEGSVRDNIAMWNSALDDADIIRAAKDACIHNEISARPGGYESPVAEAGANFSGGQVQRLEIAKALAVNPSLLILDEATSALDSSQEKQIDENLRRRGVTCLIIAHRLSTIRDCDEIIVLDEGRIVERGVHHDLYAQNGLYTQLVNL